MARGAVATVRHRFGDLVHGVTVDLGAIFGDQDLQKRWRVVILEAFSGISRRV